MNLKKYWTMYKMGVKEGSAYRLMVAGSFASTAIYVVLLLAVWTAISNSADLKGGLARVIAYIILAQAISSSVSTGLEKWFGYKIRNGTITNELKRPISLFSQAYLHEIGWQSFDTMLKSIPLLIGGILLTSMSVPSITNALAFAASWILSFHLMFMIALMTSMMVFWTKIDTGIRFSRGMIVDFFAGVIFPLYLLPSNLQEIFYTLPFHLIVDGPINIFLMERTGGAIWSLFAQQLLWIGIFFVAAELLWVKAKKKLTVQGG